MAIKVANLTDPRDLDLLREIRASSPGYARLKANLATLFQGRRCVVIGSAPDLGDVIRREDDVTIGVNGSFHNAERLGIGGPDVNFFTSYVFTQGNRVAQTVYRMLHGRHFPTCVIISGTLPYAVASAGFTSAGATADTILDITTYERAALVGEVCGMELGFGRLEERVSTGIVTAISALWAGAREVHLVGFSLEGGHSYSKFRARRMHKKPDAIFLSLCQKKGFPVSSASAELRERFALPARL